MYDINDKLKPSMFNWNNLNKKGTKLLNKVGQFSMRYKVYRNVSDVAYYGTYQS